VLGHRSSRWHAVLAAFTLSLVVASVGAPGAASKDRAWALTDLGVGLYPEGINNHGQIVGQGPGGGFSWRDGALTYFESASAIPRALNDRGDVVGSDYDPVAGTWNAVLWRNGETINLGATGTFNDATDINEKRQIVGWSYNSGLGYRSFLWQDGALTDLGHLGGNYTIAHAINNRGQVVGLSATVQGVFHAFLWQDGVMTDLGAPPDGYSLAMAINDHGLIVGYGGSNAGDRALLWEDGVLRDLGTPAGISSYAYGISKHGQVVGAMTSGPGHIFRPFVWQNGVTSEIPMLDGQYGFGLAINDRGQGVGYTISPPGPLHGLLFSQR
jgi:probable HAF family extracellular repeat protein